MNYSDSSYSVALSLHNSKGLPDLQVRDFGTQLVLSHLNCNCLPILKLFSRKLILRDTVRSSAQLVIFIMMMCEL
jgi:hypothetical protein